jgi:hypothetical protein
MRDFEASNHADFATRGGFRAIARYIGVKSCIGESVRNAPSVNKSISQLTFFLPASAKASPAMRSCTSLPRALGDYPKESKDTEEIVSDQFAGPSRLPD